MTGKTDLAVLLKSMNPILRDGEYVFCSVDSENSDWLKLEPIATFREDEGLTLVLRRECADAAKIAYPSVFRMITLSVHSSLDAVGFLAEIATKLARHGISVNPVSAYYHDHLFVPAIRVFEVMELLGQFSA